MAHGTATPGKLARAGNTVWGSPGDFFEVLGHWFCAFLGGFSSLPRPSGNIIEYN